MLVIGEVALTLVLVVAAALLVQTRVRLTHRNPGFRTDHLLLGHIYVPPARYPDANASTRFCTAFGDRLRAVPGVLDVTIATGFPPTSPWQQMFTIPGQPISRREDVPTTTFVAADAHFVGTLGLTLLSGRELGDSDTAASRPVALINQAFARRYFPAQDPVGLVIRPGPPSGISSTPLENFGSSTAEITIVGVIRDFMNDGLERPPAPQIFMLFRQLPGLNFGFKDIVVRTSLNPESLGPAVARELRALDTDIPLGEVRLALGARSEDILWLVLRYSLSIGLWGVLLGLGGAFAVHQSLAELLYGVTASDPSTLAAAATLLLVVVVTASVVPGMRAMRIDPAQALRAD